MIRSVLSEYVTVTEMTRRPAPKGPARSSLAMSAKAISEQTGKEFLFKYICTSAAVQNRFRYAGVTAETDWDRLVQEHPWLLTEVRRDSIQPLEVLCV